MLNTIRRKVRKWQLVNQTVRELTSLSDKELRDIGISRDDIRFIAREQSIY